MAKDDFGVGPCLHFYVESNGFGVLKTAENIGPLCNSRDIIIYHKGDERSCTSLVGSLGVGTGRKDTSHKVKWRRHCQDISLIGPGIRYINELL